MYGKVYPFKSFLRSSPVLLICCMLTTYIWRFDILYYLLVYSHFFYGALVLVLGFDKKWKDYWDRKRELDKGFRTLFLLLGWQIVRKDDKRRRRSCIMHILGPLSTDLWTLSRGIVYVWKGRHHKWINVLFQCYLKNYLF